MTAIRSQDHSSIRQFSEDYFHTFARLLDSDLPAASRPAEAGTEQGRWSWGQTTAFASIVSFGLWAVIAGVIYYFT